MRYHCVKPLTEIDTISDKNVIGSACAKFSDY